MTAFEVFVAMVFGFLLAFVIYMIVVVCAALVAA